MDPATLALMMGPSLVAMMNRGPSMPGANMYGGVNLPDRSAYSDAVLSSAFNPNSQLYKIASDQAMANVNQNLVNRGMAFSSAGNQALSGAQADLANKFLESELQRRLQAYNAVTGYDVNRARTQMGMAEGEMKQLWDRYRGDMSENQNFYAGLGQLGQVGAGYLGRQQQQSQLDAANQRNQANYDRYMNYLESQRANSGGMYSTVPGK